MTTVFSFGKGYTTDVLFLKSNFYTIVTNAQWCYAYDGLQHLQTAQQVNEALIMKNINRNPANINPIISPGNAFELDIIYPLYNVLFFIIAVK